MWGEDLISELGIDIELLPHTPGVSSGVMRKGLKRTAVPSKKCPPPIAWCVI